MTEPIQFKTRDLRRFGDKISEDLFGTAYYRGAVRHRCKLPYQRILLKVFNDRKTWELELDFLTKCQHKNVVELIGFAADYPNGPYYLVFPDYQNGTLEQKLPDDLEWHKKTKILKGIAMALKHFTDLKPYNIVHSEIKPKHIFLDEKYNAKISNFEDAIEGGQQKRNPRRLPIGYTDPSTVEFDPTTDIYSFGIIMLQLITKESCISIQNEHISTIVRHRLQGANHVVHESLMRTGCNTKKAESITNLALQCIDLNTENRPTAGDVVNMLQDLDAKFPKLFRKIKMFLSR